MWIYVQINWKFICARKRSQYGTASILIVTQLSGQESAQSSEGLGECKIPTDFNFPPLCRFVFEFFHCWCWRVRAEPSAHSSDLRLIVNFPIRRSKTLQLFVVCRFKSVTFSFSSLPTAGSPRSISIDHTLVFCIFFFLRTIHAAMRHPVDRAGFGVNRGKK